MNFLACLHFVEMREIRINKFFKLFLKFFIWNMTLMFSFYTWKSKSFVLFWMFCVRYFNLPHFNFFSCCCLKPKQFLFCRCHVCFLSKFHPDDQSDINLRCFWDCMKFSDHFWVWFSRMIEIKSMKMQIICFISFVIMSCLHWMECWIRVFNVQFPLKKFWVLKISSFGQIRTSFF